MCYLAIFSTCLLTLLTATACQAGPTTSTEARNTSKATTASITQASLPPCAELPVSPLSDAELLQLVPEGSPGRVRVAWKTESQEETYGFNILRADAAEGPYKVINPSIIAGEGTTNIPKGYCFEDSTVARGQTYFYQIEEVTNSGGKSIVEGTAATRVKVKTVEEERAWLKKKSSQSAAQ